MHQQIRTSPGDPPDNVRRILRRLRDTGINVEGIGPELETTHIRTVVAHARWSDAKEALTAEGFVPEDRMAIAFILDNTAGALDEVLESLREQGYGIESVLVLASRPNGKVLVSIGVAGVPPGWDQVVTNLGGWEEPDGWEGEDCPEPAS
jgi:hypothetical protein